MLEIKNLSTYYFAGGKILKAVENASFSVGDAEFFGLVGASGCGKSTLGLSIIRLIDLPGRIVQGQVLLNGTDLMKIPVEEMNSVRGISLSMVFQDPLTCLNPVITIGEQIAETMRYHLRINKERAKAASIGLLKKVKIKEPEKVYSEYPHQLSGGMRQRIMIAIAISCGAKTLIADEPTTALDVSTQAKIMELLKEFQRDFGMSVILISHNRPLIAGYCERAAVMKDGKIIFEGEAKECLKLKI